jgi:hypothetical protein
MEYLNKRKENLTLTSVTGVQVYIILLCLQCFKT